MAFYLKTQDYDTATMSVQPITGANSGRFFPSHRWDGATAQIKKGSGSGNIKNILSHLRAGMISDFSSKISHQSELSPEQAERRE